MRTPLPRKHVTKKSASVLEDFRGFIVPISHFSMKVETCSFRLKPVRKKNIDFRWRSGFLKLEMVSIWESYSLCRNFSPTSNRLFSELRKSYQNSFQIWGFQREFIFYFKFYSKKITELREIRFSFSILLNWVVDYQRVYHILYDIVSSS